MGLVEQPQYVRIFTTQPVQWDRIDPWNGGLTKKTGISASNMAIELTKISKLWCNGDVMGLSG